MNRGLSYTIGESTMIILTLLVLLLTAFLVISYQAELALGNAREVESGKLVSCYDNEDNIIIGVTCKERVWCSDWGLTMPKCSEIGR